MFIGQPNTCRESHDWIYKGIAAGHEGSHGVWETHAMRHSITGSFDLRFDAKETDKAYVLEADLPGVELRDVEISVDGNRLEVRGKREGEAPREGERVHVYERRHGHFARGFSLPDSADADHAEATLKNGVLTISIPKKPEHRPRRVEIKTRADTAQTGTGGLAAAQA